MRVNKINEQHLRRKNLFFTALIDERNGKSFKCCRLNNVNSNEKKMIKSHEKHFPSIYTWPPPKALSTHSCLSSTRHYRDCAMRTFFFWWESAKRTKIYESIARASECFPFLLGVLWKRASGCLGVPSSDKKWNEMCFVCREMAEKKREKIWFRGWSWTTYNNELNIYHSVYLHHKEINVSSTFERKIFCA